MRKFFFCLSLPALVFGLFSPGSFSSLQAQAPSASAAAPPALQTFTSQEGRFSILFPGEVQKSSQALSLGGGGSTILFQFWVETDANKVSYMIMYNDYSGTYGTGDPQSVLATVRDGAIGKNETDASKKKTLLSDAPITLNGVPGRAFTASDSSGWNYSVRQYLKGQRLYQVIIVSTVDHPAALEHFQFKCVHIRKR